MSQRNNKLKTFVKMYVIVFVIMKLYTRISLAKGGFQTFLLVPALWGLSFKLNFLISLSGFIENLLVTFCVENDRLCEIKQREKE